MQVPGFGFAHSRCLESICGDFLYIAVIVIGAIRRSRDYYILHILDSHLRRYYCTTSTCDGPTCHEDRQFAAALQCVSQGEEGEEDVLRFGDGDRNDQRCNF